MPGSPRRISNPSGAIGVVLIRGLWAREVETLRRGVERIMAEPGPRAAENLREGEAGRLCDDCCNWQRIGEFRDVIERSAVGQVAADLTGSRRVQLFHDHVLVKEAGTCKPTPWHQDWPYCFAEGRQTVSFWCPLDPVREASLRCVKGSHLWEKPVLPLRWLSEENFYPDHEACIPVPDPDAEGMEVVEWAMEPGDAVAFLQLRHPAWRARQRDGAAAGVLAAAGGMTRAVWSGRAERRRPFPGTAWRRGSGGARTGLR